MSASEEQSQGPVIRDRRRIDPVTGQPRDPDAPSGTTQAGAGQAGTAPRGTGQPRPGKHAVSKPGGPRADTAGIAEAAGNGEAGTTGTSAPEPAGSGQPQPSGDGGDAGPAAAAPSSGRDVAIMLAERTADLQRLQAEYVNYRKRVERDRAAVREQSLAAVLAELLPVLDDIGRAREHGELTGGFKSVAESLEAVAAKLGLTTYGEIGEVFDPNIHEALMHAYSPDVAETTCVQILQPGYKVGERILRPARVAVAEPADPAGARTASGETTSGGNADNVGPAGPTGPASAAETGDRAPDDTD